MKNTPTTRILAVALALVLAAGLAVWRDGGSGTAEAQIFIPPQHEFVVVHPCRIVDTREARGTLGPNETRTYLVRGSGSGFAAQGGKPDGCDIPDGAAAVEMNVTAVDATKEGYVRAWGLALGAPNATFLNYTDGFNAGNTGTVGICPGLCPRDGDLWIRNYSGTTHLVIDVFGYYERTYGETS